MRLLNYRNNYTQVTRILLVTEFLPHLSLIYASLEAVQRKEVVASCLLPFSEIAFDRVTAIMAPGKTESRADVEAWQSACGLHPLGGSKARGRLSARKN